MLKENRAEITVLDVSMTTLYFQAQLLSQPGQEVLKVLRIHARNKDNYTFIFLKGGK